MAPQRVRQEAEFLRGAGQAVEKNEAGRTPLPCFIVPARAGVKPNFRTAMGLSRKWGGREESL